MIKGFLNLPWFLWAALALIVAVIYSFVWPRKAVTVTTGFRFFILRWGHALTWILLAVNFVLRGIDPSLNGAANWVALAGGVMYLLFMVMTFVVK
jgi:hypothetical protein